MIDFLRVIFLPFLFAMLVVPGARGGVALAGIPLSYFAKREILSPFIQKMVNYASLFFLFMAILIPGISLAIVTRGSLTPDSFISENARILLGLSLITGFMTGLSFIAWSDRGTKRLLRRLAHIRDSLPILIEIRKNPMIDDYKAEKAGYNFLYSKKINRLRWMFGQPFEIVERDLPRYYEIFHGHKLSFPSVVFMYKDGSLYEDAGKSVFSGDEILSPMRYENLLRRVLARSGVEVSDRYW